MKIIAIIPARAGSKGIPGKNTKLLAGKPMISYIIESVKKVAGIDRVVVTTEDQTIAEVAKEHGAEVPFMRPAALAEDDVATLPVLQDALSQLKALENYVPDYVLLVYPTSPLLKTERIQQAIDLVKQTGADSVCSGTLTTKHFWVEIEGGFKRLYPLKLENRQKTKPLFVENGAIYLTRADILARQIVADKMMPLIMEPNENIDVDHPEDFLAVEKILQQSK